MEVRRSLPAGAGGANRQRIHGQLKGEFYVMDDFCSTDDSMAGGLGEELRDGAFTPFVPARIIQVRRLAQEGIGLSY